MSEIHYLVGDATDPEQRPCVIAHIVNDAGVMNAGFAKTLKDRYPKVKNQYLAWRVGRTPLGKRFDLGMTQIVRVNPQIQVANMLAQNGLRSTANPTPLRLHALNSCLDALGRAIEPFPGTPVVMPRIGTGLAGGEWSDIEPLIEDNLIKRDIEVYVYDLT